MSRFRLACLLVLSAASAACSGENGLTVGTPADASNNGSYTGYTLNSPVADQNPHVGGDQSYPASVSDQGKPLAPPDKLDGR